MASVERLARALEGAGQNHVLQFWPELREQERDAFLCELAHLDLEGLKDHCEGAAKAAASPGAGFYPPMEPVPPESTGGVRKSGAASLAEWEEEGLKQISANRVGVLLLAGGQGTRLGVQYPKGRFNVELPSGKTLYQIQAERILKIQELAGRKQGRKCTVPWYILTSEFTLASTKDFFEKNNHFGLEPSDIVMFEQRMIPAVTLDGKVILQGKGKLAMAPDGNGGLYQALVDNHVLLHMERRGVEYLHVYCVDNILIKMADPVFIGFCVSKGADCGAKVVEKAYAAEPVGVVCRVGGVPQVVEYSEIRQETAELRGPTGELVYGLGNICIHFFTRTFLQDVTQKYLAKLKQHVAIKKVPFVDSCGSLVTPTKPNGIKMEKFIFDVFPFSKNFVVFEVLREEEFSPLKNAAGAERDSPATARHALLTQHCRWAMCAGATLQDQHGNTLHPPTGGSPGNSPAVQFEISPLVSYFGEDLEQLRGRRLTVPLHLDQQKAKELQAQ